VLRRVLSVGEVAMGVKVKEWHTNLLSVTGLNKALYGF